MSSGEKNDFIRYFIPQNEKETKYVSGEF